MRIVIGVFFQHRNVKRLMKRSDRSREKRQLFSSSNLPFCCDLFNHVTGWTRFGIQF
jgi:hypothetical protein